MELWTCPKCSRNFQKKNQMHSCEPYPLAEHFKNKASAKKLYDELLTKLKPLGKIKVESLRCCVHLVKPSNAYTFAALYATKDGLRFHLGLDKKLTGKKIRKAVKTAENKYMYELDTDKIDKELLGWLKDAYKQK